MPRAYYNEFDPFAAAWLRELIAEGLVAYGDVDERSITEVRVSDLYGYDQCHFFAGVGGWSYALRLAGWPDDRPVWTGSCPCQSFSAAGKGSGFADPRHLWPVWFDLIRQCAPSVVFGEQVEAAVRHGWLDLVSADLERQGYAVGAAVLGAHSVGAPHIRQRLWFVADAMQPGRAEWRAGAGLGSLAGGGCGGMDIAAGGVGDTGIGTGQRDAGSVPGAEAGGDRAGREDGRGAERFAASSAASPWSDLEWLPCRDGKARPTKPGLQPLAHGVSGRVGLLRGTGNAIVPQVAAEFIRACY